MKGIFWGFFLIFINFYVTINGHTLNLLPTFAGYILLYRAAGELLGESGRFGKLRPFAVAVAIYTGILWVGDLLGVTGANPDLESAAEPHLHLEVKKGGAYVDPTAYFG